MKPIGSFSHEEEFIREMVLFIYNLIFLSVLYETNKLNEFLSVSVLEENNWLEDGSKSCYAPVGYTYVDNLLA